MTVLVIACPHALGLAVPLVLAISTTLGAQGGLLVRDRRGLEAARTLTAVVFDKTGTLTLGEHRVVDVRTVDGVLPDDALRLAAALEHDAEHPVARAIVRSAAERKLSLPVATEFTSMPGRGVRATVEGHRLAGGGPNLLASFGIEAPDELQRFANEAASRGQGVVYLVEERAPGAQGPSRVRAAFAVADAIPSRRTPSVACMKRGSRS